MQSNIGYLKAAIIRANPTLFSMAPKCEQRLAYTSGVWTRNLHNANRPKHCCTTAHYLIQTSSSTLVTS